MSSKFRQVTTKVQSIVALGTTISHLRGELSSTVEALRNTEELLRESLSVKNKELRTITAQYDELEQQLKVKEEVAEMLQDELTRAADEFFEKQRKLQELREVLNQMDSKHSKLDHESLMLLPAQINEARAKAHDLRERLDLLLNDSAAGQEVNAETYSQQGEGEEERFTDENQERMVEDSGPVENHVSFERVEENDLAGHPDDFLISSTKEIQVEAHEEEKPPPQENFVIDDDMNSVPFQLLPASRASPDFDPTRTYATSSISFDPPDFDPTRTNTRPSALSSDPRESDTMTDDAPQHQPPPLPPRRRTIWETPSGAPFPSKGGTLAVVDDLLLL
mmetsp:Transcript_10738/g.17587  ORF Transcript_10738/g.17587 Transcript_10738/m.17587 type:complete len:336 (+) Transcript_10738:46-1053(+)|eukprot:CAMPEP_0184339040 /NCGR_PEP_ID=MMETSP1089-20130417/7705_1 /TAXON_ID=38269 ORGANISM="Gloeochaete wittrockiana, Strain SAG46.84" /NCGR_SAMPLE_ID=MMETSP1089 /ASSEMBLY_ACC=CAM_ASM_000445 /LENGTH=335 /DNA_ID=CAMNT_0026666057 /DNA_START=43 /DNA_END=1050 /DNA_ORIENTATION=-